MLGICNSKSSQIMSLRRRGSIYDTRIAGLYDLGETIGKGHFAVVKSAKHVFTGEKVAVKVIDKTKIDAASKEHLMQEVRCMKLVQHPHIVRLYEVIDTQTRLFLVLELGDYDMFDYIMKQGERGVSESLAQRYFNQIIDAIDYCHQLHVVHRDLKPENVVFMEKLQTVKLTDFGFSNLFTPGQHLDTSCGSLAYSAPEILLGDSYDAPAVDIWSLGVILYMMVCGKLPFQEANDSETLTKILDCNYLLPSHLSEGCKQVIQSMLVRDPKKRAKMLNLKQMQWVATGRRGAAAPLPLVNRASVSEDVHDQIIEHMVAGNIAEADQICTAVDSDDYSHITATYYLLLERYLRKERSEHVRKHSSSSRQDSKSGSQSNLDSLALSPRTKAKLERQVVSDEVVATKPESSETSDSPTTSACVEQAAASTSGAKKLWRQRTCSIVKEESESDLSVHLIASRSASPRRGDPSPRTGSGGLLVGSRRVSPILGEAADLSGRVSRASSLGRRSNASGSSRSPSPPPLPPRTTRYRSLPLVTGGGRKLPSISSSPHLVGICEEAECGPSDTAGPSTTTWSAAPHGSLVRTRSRTMSALRLLGATRLQSGVSPDVGKRYESRSRRSTSCSSSEASDDEERRLSLIRSRFCHSVDDQRRHNNDGTDDDSDGGVAGGGTVRRCSDTSATYGNGRSGGGQAATANSRTPPGDGGKSSCSVASSATSMVRSMAVAAVGERLSPIKEIMTGNLPVGNSSPRPQRRQNGQRQNNTGSPSVPLLDAEKLASKLEKLVLAPIREIPPHFQNVFFEKFHNNNSSSSSIFSAHSFWRRLFKTRSCENVDNILDLSENKKAANNFGNSAENTKGEDKVKEGAVMERSATGKQHHRRKRRILDGLSSKVAVKNENNCPCLTGKRKR